jgi:hypothetical protein
MNIPKHIESFRKDLKLKKYAKNSIDNKIQSPLGAIKL